MEKPFNIPEFVTPCLPGIQHEYYGNYHLQYSNISSNLLIFTDDAFFSAIKSGDVSLVKKFFPKYKNVINQIKTTGGLYPLHLATIKGHFDIVKYFVEEQNALIDIVDNEKETPLLKASYNGFKDIVNFLKMKKANINFKDREGWTALHNACSRGFCDIVQLLINSEADINSQNITGQTPLMIACSKGYLDIIQLLIMTRANPLVKNNIGETAYDIAAQNSERYICAMLENYEINYVKKLKLNKEQIVHNTAIEMIYENQRSSVLNTFSSENLQKNDKCGPWSNKHGVPCSKDDVLLPKSNGWFWMTDWDIDLKSPNINQTDGWQYAKSFDEKPENWYNEPIKGLSSIVGCVRRRIWIRIRKRKYVQMNNTNTTTTTNNNNNNININNNNNNNISRIDEGSSSNNNNNSNNRFKNNDIMLNNNNIKGKNVVQMDSIENDKSINDNNEIRQYLLNAKDIVNEEKYPWDYISNNETNILVIEGQFNKYSMAIESLLKIMKGIENNTIESKEISSQIEEYFKKAEFLKEKLKRLNESSSNNNNNNNNEECQNQQNILNHSSSSESLISPLTSTKWEKDENAPLCNSCKSKFSLFNRRHHCRNCGKVFCSRCSNYQFKLKSNSQPLRVCKDCYKNLTKAKLDAVDGNISLPIEDEENINSSDDELIECPVCGKSLSLYGSDQNSIENHLKTCLDQVDGELNKVKLGNKFELQKLDHDLSGECQICFEEFQKGQTITRIDCLCIFHKECIDRWYDYRKVDGICPIHSMDN
ncbi:ankyrin [Piromyces finnis]|uniref:Ankyrin n=1 Tax=Piromyces finnis TaxID=1754191 RepID=A0A1Y1UY75_9FUNG|nr:ankyrin [Piromyces finnis]|eukprot:ORX42535.1 ankyrin [Piromyces finnis]